MLNITEFLDLYRADISVRYEKDAIFVTPPFFHIGSNESIALRFSETKDGRPIVTDCGTTRDYLELMELSLKAYRKKLDLIKERFFIKEENGAFVMEMPTTSLESVKMHLGYFIQALSIIANIDL